MLGASNLIKSLNWPKSSLFFNLLGLLGLLGFELVQITSDNISKSQEIIPLNHTKLSLNLKTLKYRYAL